MATHKLLATALVASLVALLTLQTAAAGDAPIYDSPATTEKPVQWGFGTPEEDGRPGEYYFYRAVEAIQHKEYRFAIDMYQTSASWAYKPAQYNLAVMYLNGEGIPVDKPRAMAWAALAAERNDDDYVQARELIYADLTKDEFAKANEIWRDLKKTYGDAVALERAKARWAQVKANMTGSHVGSIGNLKVGAAGDNVKPVYIMPGGRAALDANTFSASGVLTGGSMDGTTAYRQLRESDNPYDPKFEQRSGTTNVEPIVPLPDEKAAPTPADGGPTHNT